MVLRATWCIVMLSFASPQAWAWNLLGDIATFQREALAARLDEVQARTVAAAAKAEQELRAIQANVSAGEEEKSRAAAAKEAQRDQALAQEKIVVLSKGVVLNPASVGDVTSVQQSVAESILLVANPMLPTCGSGLSYRGDSAHVSWQATLDEFLKNFGSGLRAVGKLEIEHEYYTQGPGQPIKKLRRSPIGTAFAISAEHVITAGHVASLFWDASKKAFLPGVVGVYFNNGGEHSVGCPSANKDALTLKIQAVEAFRYDPAPLPKDSPLDFAVLRLAPGQAAPSATLDLSGQTDVPIGNNIVVIGYPDKDPRVEQGLWQTIMNVPVEGGMFPVTSIKRISPGQVRPPCANASKLHVGHEASTINRSSGAPVIQVSTGKVVAIQVAGVGSCPDCQEYCNLALKSSQVSLKSSVAEVLNFAAAQERLQAQGSASAR